MNTGVTPQLKIKSKPKFDKHKCLSCKYHSELSCGFPVRIKNRDSYRLVNVFCDYAVTTQETCLTKDINGNKIDRRGNDYHNCNLYEKGKLRAVDKAKRAI